MTPCRSVRLQLGRNRSKIRYLVNGVPQGSVLAPVLANNYTADLSCLSSRKFTYADDIVILFSHRKKETIEANLSADLALLHQYFRN